MQAQQSQLMTCEDIAIEIFGTDKNGKPNRSARQIAERDSMQPDYPKPVRQRKRGRDLYFRRNEIMQYYGLAEMAA